MTQMFPRPWSLLLALLVSLCGAVPAEAEEAAQIWRVCVSDLALPPYLYNDPERDGVAERLLIEAGRQAGLSVLLLRYPLKRCNAMLETGGLDALLAAPTPGNLAHLQFPMKGGAVDATRRLARINLVWVARPDSTLQWNGHALLGKTPEKVLVGTRLGMASAIEPLRGLGFKVDSTSLSIRQLMMKVALKRVDLAVALQEEVGFALRDTTLAPLVVLPRAFSSGDFYAAVRPRLAPEMQEKVEAWWTSIGRLRDTADFRVR